VHGARTERRRVRRSVRRAVQASELPEALLSEGLRLAVLLEGLRREVLRLQAERRAPLMERRSVQAEVPCPERPEAARPGVPAGLHRERPARPSAAVVPMALASRLPAAEPQAVRLTAG
jgi:hypothetical protein